MQNLKKKLFYVLISIFWTSITWGNTIVSDFHVQFHDTDPDPKQLSGDLLIYPVVKGVEYRLAWGISPETPLPFTRIICGSSVDSLSLTKVSSNSCFSFQRLDGQARLKYHFLENTPIPKEARYLLVTVEQKNKAFLSIVDQGNTLKSPQKMEFLDEDPNPNELGGTFVVQLNSQNNSNQGYTLYWGSSFYTRLPHFPSLLVVDKPSIAPNNTFQFSLPQNTTIPEGATHVLIFSYDSTGESKQNQSWKIADLGCQCGLLCPNPFLLKKHHGSCANTSPIVGVHFDGSRQFNRLEGNLLITLNPIPRKGGKYRIYWGSHNLEKLEGYGAIAQSKVSKKPTSLTEIAINHASIPPNAAYLLVYQEYAGQASPHKWYTILPPPSEDLFQFTGKRYISDGKHFLTGTLIININELYTETTSIELYSPLKYKVSPSQAPLKKFQIDQRESSMSFDLEDQEISSEISSLFLIQKDKDNNNLTPSPVNITLPTIEGSQEAIEQWKAQSQSQIGVSLTMSDRSQVGSTEDSTGIKPFKLPGLILFYDHPLTPQINLHFQIHHKKISATSEGENILNIEHNAFATTVRHFFYQENVNLYDTGFTSLFTNIFHEIYFGIGLGVAKTYFHYDGRKFILKNTENNLSGGTLLGVDIQKQRQEYSAIRNGHFLMGEVGRYDRALPYHIALQGGLYLHYDDQFDKNQILDVTNHRDYAKREWDFSKNIGYFQIGLHYFF